jgi:hypothetical protein
MFFYAVKDFSERGLTKFYSEMFIGNDGRVVQKIPLFR